MTATPLSEMALAVRDTVAALADDRGRTKLPSGPRELAALLRKESPGLRGAEVKAALAELRAAGVVDVWKRDRATQRPYYRIVPKRPPPARSALGRFAAQVKGLVAAGAMVLGVLGSAQEASAAPARGLPAHVVPFTGGLGPEPTYVPRPSYPRGDGRVGPDLVARERARGMGGPGAALSSGINWERSVSDSRIVASGAELSTGCAEPVDGPADASPGRGHFCERYRELDQPLGAMWSPHAAVTPLCLDGPAVLDLDVAPVPDARHVGRLYATAEEAAAARAARRPRLWGERPPPPDVGPGDDAPHRRLSLVYRRLFHAAREIDPGLFGPDHVAIARLIRKFGIDEACRVVRDDFARNAFRGGRSIQEIAMSTGAMYRDGKPRPAPWARGEGRFLQPAHPGPVRYLEVDDDSPMV
jgi:hypothetical protein